MLRLSRNQLNYLEYQQVLHEVILELLPYYEKKEQNQFLKWPTRHLVELIKWVRKQNTQPN